MCYYRTSQCIGAGAGRGLAGWVKVKSRDTVEAIVGGVTGSLSHPRVLLLGRRNEHGRLRYLGQTLPIPVDRQPELAAVLTRHVGQGRRGPVPHPWPNPLPGSWTASFTDRRPLPYVPVQPAVVVEVEADTALDEFTITRPGRPLWHGLHRPPDDASPLRRRRRT